MTQNLAFELIEREKREKTGFLDLGNCGLTEVPEAVRELVWLEALSLGVEYNNIQNETVSTSNRGANNKVENLPSWIDALKDLKRLYIKGDFEYDRLSFCDLTHVVILTELEELEISWTEVKDLLQLSKLKKLKSLTCSFTAISDLSSLSSLAELQHLDVTCTNVKDLMPLAGLYNLKSFDCVGTEIDDLYPLAGLSSLEYINCTYSHVSDLWALADLVNLRILDCEGTAIDDIMPLCTLEHLVELDCSDTYLEDLTPFISRIKAGLPVRWQRYSGDGIYVQNCPLIIPPVEFAKEGPEAVLEYFNQLGDDARPLNEVKVIFLGEGEAGKTSLIKRLRGEGFDQHESQTHGIRIQQTPFVIDGETTIAHCWDFGGQEVNHATHQFFLSQRCVYVVVLNSRSDDKAEKWLKHASSFGGDSPVLVVLNKIDENPAFEVDRKRLREKYPNIQDFFRLSCANGRGVAEFQQALTAQIEQAPTRRTPFPAAWLKVKEHFAHMTQDYIDSAQYRAECEADGVMEPFSQAVLLQFLHDLGLVINFRNLKNFDTQILNPLWLTNGVYRIINCERVANAQGLLHEADFDAVINDPRYDKAEERTLYYPQGKLNYIVRVMQEFELCFQLDERRYVVPQLLPKQEPDFTSQGKGLRFVIRFPELLPDSVFPRLMVKLHSFIQGDLRWRTGMVLHKPSLFDAQARVREDKEDKEIQIEVCGEEPRRFLSYIRETVKEIVGSFANLAITEWVPIPGNDGFLEYENLVAAESAREKEIFVWQVKKRIPVADLLDGVEEAAMRDALTLTPVRAFVSYSHKDGEYLPQLKAALSPLVRLDKLILWTDYDIDAGDEWNKVIFQQLAEADLVLCLVSADFIASDFCYTQELAAALTAHERNEKTVVPIRLRQCHWDDLPLAQLQGFPAEWISAAKDKDAAWTAVSKSLGPAIQKAKQRKRFYDLAKRSP